MQPIAWASKFILENSNVTKKNQYENHKMQKNAPEKNKQINLASIFFNQTFNSIFFVGIFLPGPTSFKYLTRNLKQKLYVINNV